MRKPPIALVALGVFAALTALIPLVYLVIRLVSGAEKAIEELLRVRTLELLTNTVLLTVSVTVTALAIGFAQAWFTTRTDLPASGFFAVLATLPIAIPSYVLALGLTSLLPWYTGFVAAWLTLSLATAPYVFLAVSAALIRVNTAQEEVARSLGLNRLQVLRKVTWPQVRTAVIASSLLVILYVLGEFGAVSILRFDTFTRAIYNAYRGSFDRTAAAALAMVLVLLTLLVLYFERHYRRPVMTSENVGRRLKIQLSHSKYPAMVVLALLAVAGVGLPIFALLSWTVVGSSMASPPELLQALGSSLLLALAAGIVIGIFAIGLALWVVRYSGPVARFSESVVWASHALPGIVVALAMVFVGANLTPGIYQTVWLLLAAYLVLFLPNALSVMVTPIGQVSANQEQVSRSLGVGPIRTIFRVVLPVAKPGILAGMALAALAVLKELPATLLLRPNETQTLATKLWSATETLSYAEAAPYAIALVIIAGVPALMLNRQARKLISEVQG